MERGGERLLPDAGDSEARVAARLGADALPAAFRFFGGLFAPPARVDAAAAATAEGGGDEEEDEGGDAADAASAAADAAAEAREARRSAERAAVAESASARRELASFLLEERAVEDLMGSLAF